MISFISNNSIEHKSFVCAQFNCQTSIWPIDKTLSGATTLSQSNDNEGVLHIPQSSRTKASPSDSIVSYSGYWLVGAEMQLAFSTASADWAVYEIDWQMQQLLWH